MFWPQRIVCCSCLMDLEMIDRRLFVELIVWLLFIGMCADRCLQMMRWTVCLLLLLQYSWYNPKRWTALLFFHWRNEWMNDRRLWMIEWMYEWTHRLVCLLWFRMVRPTVCLLLLLKKFCDKPNVEPVHCSCHWMNEWMKDRRIWLIECMYEWTQCFMNEWVLCLTLKQHGSRNFSLKWAKIFEIQIRATPDWTNSLWVAF